MSAWRVAGIIHGLEGWNEHECGENVLDVDKIWSAALKHGVHIIEGYDRPLAINV
ncbi:Protein CER1-like 1 [Platanthera guangdongensis]|uniref:Protein CER1-like 1 n=1 Tax=Platanthera guangdongensis TaxID=2320717 RepID=A0ABR2N0P0_9ASPA